MAEYRIDDLARVSGTTVRNIRVYQDRGLLPPPIRRGRTAIYTDAHLSRLRLVTNMLGRGYAFAQIAEMLAAWESGRSLADVLGLEEAMGVPWSSELPVPITVRELRRMFGTQLTPGNTRKALQLGLLRRQGAGLVVPSPQLLEAGYELVRLGVPLDEVIDLAGVLQQEVDHVAALMISLVRRYVLDPKGDDWLPRGDEVGHYADVLRRLPTVVISAVTAAVARSTERVIPDMVGDRLEALLRSGGQTSD
ncbi:MerR family transcriptional regulator [Kibdelosporangium phytohabitans]|uniref:MerR family transcriptional regulator n=1 Tax=Kibdelosporangium phytohabitans TaxID=860235 RepID=A0A0N9HWN9_9PSEU|nr:MerR family transcriptional regulator [Kibdelosporangium phytohabitans]ALG06556.1 MerR family transcriptional regulator [Kibdelosporangium phytohabitans]MBE1467742.1 DNA-binding transcriptional MerR regulator [Kibdelosporangium phytohabitans]